MIFGAGCLLAIVHLLDPFGADNDVEELGCRFHGGVGQWPHRTPLREAGNAAVASRAECECARVGELIHEYRGRLGAFRYWTQARHHTPSRSRSVIRRCKAGPNVTQALISGSGRQLRDVVAISRPGVHLPSATLWRTHSGLSCWERRRRRRGSASIEGGPLNLNNFRRRMWGPAVEAAGITKPARIYDLRSTFASNVLAAGVTVFELKVMGTSVATIERHYGTLIGGAHAGIAGRLDALEAEMAAVEDGES
ncbi:MAG TPA: hypothetical protein VNB86_12530 [Gaiellaceae bacterium]|jgi:hypothetical protein|nr:hypothetical protein [Gaiellaceae bacterium]